MESMYCETLEGWKVHKPAFSKAIDTAVNWVIGHKTTPLPMGKVEIGNGIFAIVQKYATQAPKEFENHHKYIDLQILMAGTEWLYWTQNEIADPSTQYNPDKDIEFVTPKKPMNAYTKIVLEGDRFVLLWPNDWHMPCICPSEKVPASPPEVTKIVVKIPLETSN